MPAIKSWCKMKAGSYVINEHPRDVTASHHPLDRPHWLAGAGRSLFRTVQFRATFTDGGRLRFPDVRIEQTIELERATPFLNGATDTKHPPSWDYGVAVRGCGCTCRTKEISDYCNSEKFYINFVGERGGLRNCSET